jgi:hypothetical protein
VPSGRPPAAGEVAHHRADVRLRNPYHDLVDRLEQRDLALLGRLAEGERARGLERRVGRVDAVRLAVDQRHPKVYHRVSRHDPPVQLARTPFSTDGM